MSQARSQATLRKNVSPYRSVWARRHRHGRVYHDRLPTVRRVGDSIRTTSLQAPVAFRSAQNAEPSTSRPGRRRRRSS